MNPTPIYDASAAIACTATSEEIPTRIEQVERMRTNLDRLERTPHGLLLHFPNRPDIDADLRKFTLDGESSVSASGLRHRRARRCSPFAGTDHPK